jgi:hypothetical protein
MLFEKNHQSTRISNKISKLIIVTGEIFYILFWDKSLPNQRIFLRLTVRISVPAAASGTILMELIKKIFILLELF